MADYRIGYFHDELDRQDGWHAPRHDDQFGGRSGAALRIPTSP
jgi:hypothetical protein